MISRYKFQGLTLSVLIFLALATNHCSGVQRAQTSSPAQKNSAQSQNQHQNSQEQLNKPYVVLVSLDGFRHDYIEKFHAERLSQIEQDGRSTEGLIPAFPTKTFPNHYSIATGLLPSHHGLIDNNFYDPLRGKSYSMSDPFTVRDGSWYGGEPLWVVAERANMVTASYFWVGSEAEILGFRPTYYFNYNESEPNTKRVDQVLNWLHLPDATRPHLITLYFSIVDSAGHTGGPESPAVAKSVKDIDDIIGKLQDGLTNLSLPINLIIVSDHGMTALDTAKVIDLTKIIDVEKFEISGGGAFASLHSKNAEEALKAYQSLKNNLHHAEVYLRSEIPDFYKIKDSPKLGDIVIIAEMPYYIITRPMKDPTKLLTQSGSHGWSNSERDMHGIFLAIGPNVLPGPKLKAFDNVNVYPFILQVLELQQQKPIDGDWNVLKPIFRKIN